MKNLTLTAVYTMIVFFLASAMFFTNSVKKEASIILAGAPELILQRLFAGRHDFIPVAAIDAVMGMKGVQSVKARLWGYYYFSGVGANLTLMANNDVPSGRVILGAGVARALRVHMNDTIPFKVHDGTYLYMETKGILNPGSELVSSDLALISEPDFRKLFDIPKAFATDLAVKVENPADMASVTAEITRLFPDVRPITRDDVLRTYEGIFSWRSGLLAVILASGVFAFIILAWDKATGLSAEDRKEVGILKGVGWETRDIILVKFWEGFAISVSCFILGVLLAYIHVFIASSALFQPALLGWSVLHPSLKLTPFINFGHVAALFFLTTIPYTIAAIAPSWRAAKIEPDSIMRA